MITLIPTAKAVVILIGNQYHLAEIARVGPGEPNTSVGKDGILTLAKLKHGDRAVITHIEMPEAQAARLAARGIVPGTSVGILQHGDPVLIGIEDDRWALDRHEASAIHVDQLEQARSRFTRLFRRS